LSTKFTIAALAAPRLNRAGLIAPDADDSNRALTAFLATLALVLPPLNVFLKVGASVHFWINLALTAFGYLPGVAHAMWVILSV